MTLQKRLARMEAQRAPGKGAVSVVYFCDAITGEPLRALILGQGKVARHDGETAQDFKHRTAEGQGAILLPDDGREALADPDTPAWARPEIIIQALREKHGMTAA